MTFVVVVEVENDYLCFQVSQNQEKEMINWYFPVIPTIILVMLAPNQEGRMGNKLSLISGHHGNPTDFKLSYSSTKKLISLSKKIMWGWRW